jgi:hypothetical protein
MPQRPTAFRAIALMFAALSLTACTTSSAPALVGLAPEPAGIAAAEDGSAIQAAEDVGTVPASGDGAVVAIGDPAPETGAEDVVAYAEPPAAAETTVVGYSGGGSRERECLMRAMYFESNRSSRDGLLAVGTVVMNRVQSGKYPRTVCGVVGQRGQFAPGVLRRRMRGDLTDLAALADSILAGKRHPRLYSRVMHFHQQGLRFPYRNMHYVLNAGGNSFYEKRSRKKRRR